MSFPEFLRFATEHPLASLDDTFVSGFDVESKKTISGRWLSNRFSVIFFRACREELLHLFFPSRPGSGIAGRLTTPRVSLQAQPR